MSDDPCDDLSRHRAVNAAEAGFRVYPTFREDSALLVEVPGTFTIPG
jgi:glucuronate isomerase